MPQERVEQFIQARKLGRNRFKALCGKGDLAQTVGATPVTNTDWTVWARFVSDPEPMIVYFTPTIIPFTILVHGLPILLRIEDDGRYWISGVDYGDYLAAIGGNSLPVNLADFIHTHANNSSGGQLNASQIFNAGIVAQQFGGTGANLSASSAGSIFYQNALSQFVALAPGSNGNVYHVASGIPTSGTLNLDTANLSGTLAYARGGLNVDVSAFTDGSIVLKGTTTASGLAPGSNGNIAQVAAGAWTSAAPSFAASVITSGQLLLERGGTEADLSATGAGHLIQATTGAAVSVILDNFAAAVAPTVNEDSGDGYAIGSLWLDTTNDNIYMAIDVSVGAAVWEHLNATSGGSSPFTTTSNVIHPNVLTDNFSLGTSSNLGKSAVVGDADEVQQYVQAYNDQSAANVVEWRDLGNNIVFRMTSDSQFHFAGFLTQAGGTFLDGAMLVNDSEGDNDFRYAGLAESHLLFGDAGNNRVGIRTASPTDTLHVNGSTSLDGAVTINETGADVDFRVESDTQANALFLDGATGAVQQLGNTPLAYLHMAASTTALASGLIPAGTAPTSPPDGSFWNDSAQNVMMMNIDGKTLNTVTGRGARDASSTFASTTEASISDISSADRTIPADFWKAQKSMLLYAGGIWTQGSSNANLTLAIKLGSVTITSVTLTQASTESPSGWAIMAAITCRTVGASGVFAGRIILVGRFTGFPAGVPSGSSTATVDTTASHEWDLTADYSSTAGTPVLTTMICIPWFVN